MRYLHARVSSKLQARRGFITTNLTMTKNHKQPAQHFFDAIIRVFPSTDTRFSIRGRIKKYTAVGA
jgi:hypothetical protein